MKNLHSPSGHPLFIPLELTPRFSMQQEDYTLQVLVWNGCGYDSVYWHFADEEEVALFLSIWDKKSVSEVA